jgi:hypothetical protein
MDDDSLSGRSAVEREHVVSAGRQEVHVVTQVHLKLTSEPAWVSVTLP